VVSQADADIDLAISVGYEAASHVAGSSEVAIAELDSAAPAAPSKGETSLVSATDTEAVADSEDASDSVATVTPTPAVPAPSPSDITASSSPAPETFLASISHDQFTFPPRPAFSQSSTGSGVAHDDDAVLVDDSSEGGSAKGTEDDWAVFDV
jgi:hypothetical protein